MAEGLTYAQVASRLARLHAAGLWHGRLNAETVLLRGPAAVDLLGACSTESLQSAAAHLKAEQPPSLLRSQGQRSLEELTSLWCAGEVSLQLDLSCSAALYNSQGVCQTQKSIPLL